MGAIWGLILAGSTARAEAPSPNLAACPPIEQTEGGERERTKPLPVPAAARAVLRSDLVHYAVAALGGGTVCVDTSFMESTEKLALSPDGRFLSFGWLGYEAYGHVIVDRTGKGEVIETGVAPVFSPSRRYFAAADQTESEFGSLSGLAVWEVGPAGIRGIGRVNELPRMHDWHIDSWAGENCIYLSAVSLDLAPAETAKTARVRYRAQPGKAGWHVTQAPGGCATK